MDFPVALQVGPWEVHPHPVFEALAYAVGFQAFLALRRRQGDPVREHRALLVLCAVLGALVGSKLLALLVDPAATWAGRGDWRTWAEGKTIVGGLLGGLVAVELAKGRLGIRQATGDLYAIPLVLGIAIGRVGCFLTGLPDRTYGVATGTSWGVDFGDGILRHPTQLYEIVFLLGVLLPALLMLRGGRPGDRFRLFMAGYLGFRLLAGFLQPTPTLLGLSAIQWACLLGLLHYAPHLPRLNPFRRPAHA